MTGRPGRARTPQPFRPRIEAADAGVCNGLASGLSVGAGGTQGASRDEENSGDREDTRRADPPSQHPRLALPSIGDQALLTHPTLELLRQLGLNGMGHPSARPNPASQPPSLARIAESYSLTLSADFFSGLLMFRNCPFSV
jgi:hypothetical protein